MAACFLLFGRNKAALAVAFQVGKGVLPILKINGVKLPSCCFSREKTVKLPSCCFSGEKTVKAAELLFF